MSLDILSMLIAPELSVIAVLLGVTLNLLLHLHHLLDVLLSNFLKQAKLFKEPRMTVASIYLFVRVELQKLLLLLLA